MTEEEIKASIVDGLGKSGFVGIEDCSGVDGILIRAKMVKDGVIHGSHVHLAPFEISGHMLSMEEFIAQRIELAHRIVSSSIQSAQHLAALQRANTAKEELENARIAVVEALAGENQRLRDENRMLRIKLAEALGLLPNADAEPATPSLPDING